MNIKRQQVIKHLNSKLPPTILVQHTESKTNEYLELVGEDQTVTLIILFPDESGCYLKLPQKWIPDPIGYLKKLSQKNYYFLLVRDDQYSFPVPIEKTILHWNPEMAKSKGNENRLQFHGQVSKVTYQSLQQYDIFGNSVLHSLINLVK